MARYDAPLHLLGWSITMLFFLCSFDLVNASPIFDAVELPAKKLAARSLVSPSSSELLNNTIAFGTAATCCFFMRLLSRAWVLKSWHLDDTLMVFTFAKAFYISLLTLINVSARYNTNLYPPEQTAEIFANAKDVADRIYGSKIVIPLEQSMIATTWGVKFCIWYFLVRVNKTTQWEKSLWFLFGYLWFSFFMIEIVYFGVLCRPFDQYWAMPVKNPECATYHKYSIIQMVFNISSDLWLVASPMPLVHQSKFPMKRKIVLGTMFALALITILAAILNKVYNFGSPLTTVYQLWYIREASVAVCVGNLICSWQLLQKLFKLRSFDDKRADIQPLENNPNLHVREAGEGVASAFGRGINIVRRKVRGLYDDSVLEATAVDESKPDTLRSEREFDCSTATSQTAFEPGSPVYSEGGKANPLGAHPVTPKKEQASKFASFVGLGRQKNQDQYTDIRFKQTQLMTFARDGDDAGPALAYRDENDII